ncbi:hypothetical protein RDI58_018042 [Solanum bulbocastanum]|uniref:Uncharacterized protein n=1 Tax=Solanum bulbocastanum TaxID=147425 RepID=A0AAN8Y9R5_SOLBU
MARNLSTTRVKASLEELHACKQCQPWSFGFILLVAMYSGALNFGSRLQDGKVTWLQITLTGLLVNWSTKTEVKLGTFSLGTFWKVEYARGLITTSIVDVVGLHILLSNINDFAKLRDGVATVRTMVYALKFHGFVLEVLISKSSSTSLQQRQKSSDRIAELQTKIETVLRKSTSLSLLRDIRETMAAKVWTTTLRTRLISSGKDCNEPGWDSFDNHPWGQGLFDPGGRRECHDLNK